MRSQVRPKAEFVETGTSGCNPSPVSHLAAFALLIPAGGRRGWQPEIVSYELLSPLSRRYHKARSSWSELAEEIARTAGRRNNTNGQREICQCSRKHSQVHHGQRGLQGRRSQSGSEAR